MYDVINYVNHIKTFVDSETTKCANSEMCNSTNYLKKEELDK